MSRRAPLRGAGCFQNPRMVKALTCCVEIVLHGRSSKSFDSYLWLGFDKVNLITPKFLSNQCTHRLDAIGFWEFCGSFGCGDQNLLIPRPANSTKSG